MQILLQLCRRGLLPQSFHQETRCNGGIRQEWDHEEDANIDVTEEEGDEDEFDVDGGRVLD